MVQMDIYKRNRERKRGEQKEFEEKSKQSMRNNNLVNEWICVDIRNGEEGKRSIEMNRENSWSYWKWNEISERNMEREIYL